MRKLFAATLLATVATAAPAFAQDAAAPFTGPRAEIITGWDHTTDSSINTGSRDGIAYGGAIGYDFQSGGTVFGVEGEATGSTARDTAHDALAAGDRLRAGTGRDLYVGGRLGFIVGDHALVYAKAGYTNAHFNTRYQLTNTDTRVRYAVDGWRLGAGTEVKLTDRVYGKAEYRYSKYDDGGLDAKRHQVVAGLGVRF